MYVYVVSACTWGDQTFFGSSFFKLPRILRTFHLQILNTFSRGIRCSSGACLVNTRFNDSRIATFNNVLFNRRGGTVPNKWGRVKSWHCIWKRATTGAATIRRIIKVSGLLDSLYLLVVANASSTISPALLFLCGVFPFSGTSGSWCAHLMHQRFHKILVISFANDIFAVHFS